MLPPSYNVGPTYVEALVFADSILSPIINLTCNCFSIANDLEWISHNATNYQITVQTNNSKNAGIYQIVLIQYFENFTDVRPQSSFQLNIKPIFLVQKPPHFEPALKSQTVA